MVAQNSISQAQLQNAVVEVLTQYAQDRNLNMENLPQLKKIISQLVADYVAQQNTQLEQVYRVKEQELEQQLQQNLDNITQDSRKTLHQVQQQTIPDELLQPVREDVEKVLNSEQQLNETAKNRQANFENILGQKQTATLEQIERQQQQQSFLKPILEYLSVGIALVLPYGVIFALLWHLFMV